MKYFSLLEFERSETALRRGIDNKLPGSVCINVAQLVQNVLDPAREMMVSPIIVTSGYRCAELNKAIGGARLSQHCMGQAADIVAHNGDNIKLLSTLKRLPYDQLIAYRSKNTGEIKWIHVSYCQSGNRRLSFSKYV
ncbi:MAG: D-Ala-D-Ala carboxypeptidase family metallohydrolase [Bacteroidales bacterium]|nr:D-Ala-D-Ala carboxypeptidase family metallohydrolase [Bacteroidales bacterium]